MDLIYIIDKKYDKRFLKPGDKKAEENFIDTYRRCTRFLESTRKTYQESWDTIGKRFSRFVAKETCHDWFYPQYECVISTTIHGISNWGQSPKIVRSWQENPFVQRRITAHELILSHYFEIYRRYYGEHGLTDKQVWALAEIAAFALTSLDQAVKDFWPWDHAGYYTDHNYPEIVPLQKKLWQPFIKRKNFDEYILKGIKTAKKDLADTNI